MRKNSVFTYGNAGYIKLSDIEYTHYRLLKMHISDMGRILPRRVTGLCSKRQRQMSKAIKRAREMAILPYINR